MGGGRQVGIWTPSIRDFEKTAVITVVKAGSQETSIKCGLVLNYSTWKITSYEYINAKSYRVSEYTTIEDCNLITGITDWNGNYHETYIPTTAETIARWSTSITLRYDRDSKKIGAFSGEPAHPDNTYIGKQFTIHYI